MGNKIEETNALMAKYAPELASEYSRYPLNNGRSWLKVTETTPKGEPCYISSTDTGIKLHYVYGPGPKGFGYYHLMTRESYVALYARMTQESPVPFCCMFFFSKKDRKEYEDYDMVQTLVYARSRSTKKPCE